MLDEMLRAACFASLDVLSARFGDDIPYRGGLDAGFAYPGGRVAFLSPYNGIHKARQQTGPAALSINTNWRSPYEDEPVEDGFLYAYRAAAIDQSDNRALRAAYELHVPIVYFFATRAGRYKPFYPCYVTHDNPIARHVIVTPGRMVGPLDDREPELPESELERKYAVRETRVRLHQARFRARVLNAYAEKCTICRLREGALLDAAHIVGDLETRGEPAISNGLSLCSIHHRAFDNDLVGVSPDYQVHVSKRLLEDEDGPMLELLKQFHAQPIAAPTRRAWKPDRERLAERFERFLLAS